MELFWSPLQMTTAKSLSRNIMNVLKLLASRRTAKGAFCDSVLGTAYRKIGCFSTVGGFTMDARDGWVAYAVGLEKSILQITKKWLRSFRSSGGLIWGLLLNEKLFGYWSGDTCFVLVSGIELLDWSPNFRLTTGFVLRGGK